MKQKLIYFSILLLTSNTYITSGQQLTDPTLNIPVVTAPGTAPVVAYPGLQNMTGVTKFNLIRSITPDQPLTTLPAGSTSYKYRQNTDYFDGLGRPLQSIVRRGHADGYDIVQQHVYDQMGREKYSYLPFACPSLVPAFAGGIKMDAYDKLRAFYDQAGPDEQPYSRSDYDDAEAGKIVKQLAPGRSWVGSGRGKQYDYILNQQNEVRRWDIGRNEPDVPFTNSFYDAGQLYVEQTTDEDGKIVREYKDKNGLVVLKKVQVRTGNIDKTLHENFACTYFVYDDQNRLRYTISPLAVSKIDGTWNVNMVPELCFSYFYDPKGRVVVQKIPGKAAEEKVYDKRDRLVFSRDGNQKSQGKWTFIVYDGLNRPICSGLISTGETRNALQSIMDDNQVYSAPWIAHYLKDYSLYNTYPAAMASCNILSYTYYDDYGQLSGISYDFAQFTDNLPPAGRPELVAPPQTASTVTRGRVTGTKIAVLNPETDNIDHWITTANFYDDNGRLVQSSGNNIKDGKEITSNLYYFQGMPWRTITHHENPEAHPVPGASDGPITSFNIVKTFERNIGIAGGNDAVWRITQKINGGPAYELVDYDYDHLGRNTTKNLNVGVVLNEYNIRGFLRHINAEDRTVYPFKPIFEERICYDTGFASKLYNGNIAGITWNGSDGEKRAYGYSYDQLDRLNHAEFRLNDGTWNHNTKDYTASRITYDLNGNLLIMDQKGWDPLDNSIKDMDKLTYAYQDNTNKLLAVQDDGDDSSLPDFKNGASGNTEYTYDYNGNLVTDDNKQISGISYYHFNKPKEITVTGKGKIQYFYDALGNLLEKRVSDDSTVIYDYYGGFVYKDNVLQYILNEEGRARPIANDTSNHQTRFVYDYFIKDHLGNVRSTVTANPITSDYMARHEIATANIEQLVFDNIPIVRDGKPISTDPNDNKAAHLIAADANQRIGTAIMLKVMPGDKFTINAESYYEGDYMPGETVEGNQVIESLLSALMGGSTYAGVPVSELPDNIRTVKQILENPALAGQIETLPMQNADPNAPQAHLKYLFFDDRMQLVPGLSGGVQVPVNNGGGWQAVDAGSVCNCAFSAPGTSGFVLIYIDNQSIGKDVWFDNIHIEHYTSNVLSEDHYYPFGLTVQLDQSGQGNLPAQPYKYNGKELEQSFGLEYYDYGARMYDPQRGQWTGVDPLADKYYGFSPFAYTLNNPVKYIDPDGQKVEFATKKSGENEAITMTLTGKLANESSKTYTTKQMQSFADRAAASITTTFSGKDGDVSWNSTVNLGVANENNPVNSTDHVFHIVNPEDVPRGAERDALGSTLGGSKDIYLSTELFENDRKPATEGPFEGTGKTVDGKGTLERTTSHEVGHSNTLDHPQLGTTDGNIMHQTIWQNGGMKTTKSQILQMRKAGEQKRLNLQYEKPKTNSTR